MGKGIVLFLLAVVASAQAGEIPLGAQQYAPFLVEQQAELWPTVPQPWTMAGLVEQESCISLKHSRCWNPKAELKTSREYGFGLGQITVAYRADGTERFNIFQELKAKHASLRQWQWDDRHNPRYQLTAIVEMNRGLWKRVGEACTTTDQWAFTLSSYNGGYAGLAQDRRLCSNTEGCDPGQWFGNVELTSLKSKLAQPGYGDRSWYQINRDHVRKVLTMRRDKYRIFWGRNQ